VTVIPQTGSLSWTAGLDADGAKAFAEQQPRASFVVSKVFSKR